VRVGPGPAGTARSYTPSAVPPAPRRQVIPRPPTWRPGGPAPWAPLSEGDRRGVTAERVRKVVEAHHAALSGRERVTFDGFPDPGAPSAVLVPVFEEAGEARVVLTRRAAHLRTHTGEVSFPGGRLEPGESPESGSRREAHEEVGLDPAAVTAVGHLSQLATFSSGSRITPVVGLLAERPALDPNPAEVEHVFDVALAELAADGVFREEWWQVPGRPALATMDAGGWFPVWFFELPDDTVWGATARMLVELLRLVLDV